MAPLANTTGFPELHVILNAPGERPETVSIKRLSGLLSATQEALSAVCAMRGEESVPASLLAVREGSAAFVVASPAKAFAHQIDVLYEAATAPWAALSAKAREALKKLASRGKSISLAVVLPSGEVRPPIPVRAPEPPPGTRSYVTVVYGVLKVAGEQASGARFAKIDAAWGDDRDTYEFRGPDAEERMESAGHLLNRYVRAKVRVEIEAGERVGGEILELQPREKVDLLTALKQARAEMEAKGIEVDVEAWLKELEE